MVELQALFKNRDKCILTVTGKFGQPPSMDLAWSRERLEKHRIKC